MNNVKLPIEHRSEICYIYIKHYSIKCSVLGLNKFISKGESDMKTTKSFNSPTFYSLFLIIFTVLSLFSFVGCGGGGIECLICPPKAKKPKCSDDERHCHGVCFPKDFECPKENTTDSDVYIKSNSSCKAYNFPDLRLAVYGVAYGPVGTEISFEFDNPILDANIYCYNTKWDEVYAEDYCVRNESSTIPVTGWSITSIEHSDKFAQQEEITVYVNGNSVTTTVDCPDATGDIAREDCFTYHQIATSECPAEDVFDVCTDYLCDSEVSVSFPSEFTNCEIIDCTTIDCDQAQNIYIDGHLSWIEFIDGEEREASCF